KLGTLARYLASIRKSGAQLSVQTYVPGQTGHRFQRLHCLIDLVAVHRNHFHTILVCAARPFMVLCGAHHNRPQTTMACPTRLDIQFSKSGGCPHASSLRARLPDSGIAYAGGGVRVTGKEVIDTTEKIVMELLRR